MNEKLAEFVGAMIGDGCLTVARRSNGTLNNLALLTGHLINDRIYYESVLRPIINENFGVNGYLKVRAKYNCMDLVMSKSIFDFLRSLNFPIGVKYNSLAIPNVIFSNDNFVKACIRGIFDTDGTIYRRYSKKYNRHTKVYDYLTIQIKMKNNKIITQIYDLLQMLGINCNRVISDGIYSVLRITDQAEINRFIEIIKPSNPYHIERYLSRCKRSKPTGP